MSGLLVAVALVVLLVGTEAFFSTLSVLNRRHEERLVEAERDWVEAELDVDDSDELLAYHRAKTGLSLVQSWIGLVGLLLVLFSGLFADVVALLQSTGLSPLAQGILFVAGAVVLSRLVEVPFDLYDTFVIEENFGFNNQTPGRWLADFLLGTGVGVVIVTVLAAAVLWFVEAVPLWPAAAWALVVTFSLAMLVLKPRVIDPLFYEFTPIEESDLRDAVDDVFERAGFRCEQVYEMDASSRSSHSNAYFVGFGPAKRVVLFDTLVDGMDREEIQSVLAHELAHWKKAHIWKFVGLFAARFAVVFAILGYLVGADWLYAPFAVPQLPYVGLTLALLWVAPVNRLSSPLNNFLSLRFEREADAYAVDLVSGEAMASALTVLASENLAALFPHPLYETFHYDHPPIPERVRFVRDLDGSEQPTESSDPADRESGRHPDDRTFGNSPDD
jgi:STE24 endopeptidase